MIGVSNVSDLVAQYEKHGWQLQRILLTRDLFTKLQSALAEDYRSTVVALSDVDALWFSRPNGNQISWEIRRLTGPPFALVRFVPINATEFELEEILRAAEIEIDDSLRSQPTEH